MGKYSISGLFFIASIFLFAIATLIGSHLDANGLLIEPAFFCIPLGYLALLISFLTALYDFTKEKIFKNSQ
ncbi:DUF3955 domain-containing protein [Enterococcus dongliensis]|uniref:DUF3955 domain-containing protein n=1 Tax=Enterococcus dongliensis TaxID=2559925 RepID=UPI00288E2AE0|nr:DUF3955 domain-containing protein [Enterococcus dongliensis]MDT2612501.1 DUF3955 domain-containing protein [Enterococcus dongliensis]